MTSKSLPFIIVAVAVAALAGLFVSQFVLSRGDDQFSACRASNIAGGAVSMGGAFTLTDENGVEVTEAEVFVKPTLLYFGYTFCPDVCPTDTARNAEVADILIDRGYSFQPAIITVDPERDTPEVLKDYTDYLHPEMLGLTGSPEQIKAVSQLYRAYYKRLPSDDDEFYLVDHSAFSYLVLPKHGFVEVFRRDESAERIADRAACFLEKS